MLLEEVRAVVGEWPRYASEAQVDERHVRRIARARRLTFPEA